MEDRADYKSQAKKFARDIFFISESNLLDELQFLDRKEQKCTIKTINNVIDSELCISINSNEHENYSASNIMLNQEQISKLIPYLEKFVKTGYIM